MLEILITRIFSVILLYHLAFLAISVAMLGVCSAGLVIVRFRQRFSRDRAGASLTFASMIYAVLIVAAFAVILQMRIRITPEALVETTLKLLLVCLLIGAVFFFGGFVIALSLTHFTERAGVIYWFNLLGSAFGCLAVILVLDWLGGPNAILVTALLGSLAGALFMDKSVSPRLRRGMVATLLALLCLVPLNMRFEFFRINYTKGYHVPRDMVLFNKWNSFSRVAVVSFPQDIVKVGWGFADPAVARSVEHLSLLIDDLALSPIINFTGDFAPLEFLKSDITALGFHTGAEDSDVLSIGSGGGRDILAALLFGSRRVVGVEINPLVIKAVEDELGEFSGRIYKRPDVELVIAEARSYLARTDAQFDFIQLSFVDTWAATSQTAFALAENNLYTVEAFEQYLDRLRPGGMLMISRFHQYPSLETLRLLGLYKEAMHRRGADDIKDRMVVARIRDCGICMMKPDGFSASDLSSLVAAMNLYQFDPVYMPGEGGDPLFDELVHTDLPNEFYARYSFDVFPPEDDRPFFFIGASLGKLIFGSADRGTRIFMGSPVIILLILLLLLCGLSTLFVVMPLRGWSRGSAQNLSPRLGPAVYFLCLGLGYILIEMGVIQRFTLLLGHPAYSLSVTLFSLLFFSGVGSLVTQRVSHDRLFSVIRPALAVLLVLLLLAMFIQPAMVQKAIAFSRGMRIVLAVLSMAPIGFLMGMPFPMGLRALEPDNPVSVPWMWGINAMASVLASVAAVMLAIHLGFTAVLATGVFCYGLALVSAWQWRAGIMGSG